MNELIGTGILFIIICIVLDIIFHDSPELKEEIDDLKNKNDRIISELADEVEGLKEKKEKVRFDERIGFY